MSIFSTTKNGTPAAEKSLPTVFKTSDYSKFKIISSNRAINKNHVKRLVESFSKTYLYTVITVNDDLEIIDGQHRFTAAKELGLPVFYTKVSGYGVPEIQALNTNQRNWTRNDYLKSYCDSGNEAYLELRAFMKEFPDFGIQAALRIVTGYDRGYQRKTNGGLCMKSKDFENGDLQLGNITKAYINARKVLQFKDYYSGFNRITFVNAITPLFDKKNIYDHARMLQKLKVSPIKLENRSSVSQYRYLIQQIYNWKAGKDDRSDFINI